MSNRIYFGEYNVTVTDDSQTQPNDNPQLQSSLHNNSFYTAASSEISKPRTDTLRGIFFESPQQMWRILQSLGGRRLLLGPPVANQQ